MMTRRRDARNRDRACRRRPRWRVGLPGLIVGPFAGAMIGDFTANADWRVAGWPVLRRGWCGNCDDEPDLVTPMACHRRDRLASDEQKDYRPELPEALLQFSPTRSIDCTCSSG